MITEETKRIIEEQIGILRKNCPNIGIIVYNRNASLKEILRLFIKDYENNGKKASD